MFEPFVALPNELVQVQASVASSPDATFAHSRPKQLRVTPAVSLLRPTVTDGLHTSPFQLHALPFQLRALPLQHRI
jgi:hypothetical protein